jgi:RNA polymerase sigma-70 factor (ECF subfamily)
MVRKLTLNQRIVFSLVDMYGMKTEEVADILEISVLAAKGLLYRARMNIDSFFADHCNVININNSCSCKAWLEFYRNRDNLQQQTKKLIDALDYREKNYQFRPEVRNKIRYLYSNMPDKKPREEWYQNVLKALDNRL